MSKKILEEQLNNSYELGIKRWRPAKTKQKNLTKQKYEEIKNRETI